MSSSSSLISSATGGGNSRCAEGSRTKSGGSVKPMYERGGGHDMHGSPGGFVQAYEYAPMPGLIISSGISLSLLLLEALDPVIALAMALTQARVQGLATPDWTLAIGRRQQRPMQMTSRGHY